jgi:hypothetical protein
MIAFWVGMFAVVMLLLMCFEPRGGGYSARPTGKGPGRPPQGGTGRTFRKCPSCCYSGEPPHNPGELPKAGSGQSN